jgi:hypothetical protein
VAPKVVVLATHASSVNAVVVAASDNKQGVSKKDEGGCCFDVQLRKGAIS